MAKAKAVRGPIERGGELTIQLASGSARLWDTREPDQERQVYCVKQIDGRLFAMNSHYHPLGEVVRASFEALKESPALTTHRVAFPGGIHAAGEEKRPGTTLWFDQAAAARKAREEGGG